MKKIFTLIATAFVALSVNAQKITFNFSNFEDASYEEAVTVNGLKINAASGKTIAIDASNKTVEDVAYTKRLKFGGTGSATSRNIAFDVTSAGTLKVILLSSSSSATDRSIGIAVDGTEVKEIAAPDGTNPQVATADITAPGEIIIYSKKSGVNLYLVEFEAAAPTGVETWDASTFDLSQVTSRENSGANLKQVPEQYPGEAPTKEDGTVDEDKIKADATAPLILTDYIFTVKTASVTLTGVSTPNSDQGQDEAWRFGSTNENQFLNTDACPVKFAGSYLQAKTGNPSMSDIEYFFTNSSGSRVGPRTLETYWEPNCGFLPAKGEYIEVSFDKAGTFTAGLFIQRPTSNLYILDKETIQLLAPSAISFAGFNNNNTVEPVEGAGAYQEMKLNEDYTFAFANPEYTINTGKQIFGFATFAVEAGKTYLMFNPKNQLGIYGFQFTEADPANVEAITTKTQKNNANATLYNLAGQKVDKSYKGIVIQNGRKFYNK